MRRLLLSIVTGSLAILSAVAAHAAEPIALPGGYVPAEKAMQFWIADGYLHASGTITSEAAKAFARIMSENAVPGVIRLRSPGGEVGAALW